MTEDKPERPEWKSDFVRNIFPDWENAMDQFFQRVERKRETEGLTDGQVYAALDMGYGSDVADAWEEWVDSE